MYLGMKGGVRESSLAAAALILVALTIAAPPPTAARAEEELQPTVKIAVAVSLTGASNVFDVPALDGARLAVDEADVEGLGPHPNFDSGKVAGGAVVDIGGGRFAPAPTGRLHRRLSQRDPAGRRRAVHLHG